MLPLALHLFENNLAETFLENALEHSEDRCILLSIIDEEKGLGSCSKYEFRPFVCRVFGIAGRTGKRGQIEYSICALLKENIADTITNDHSNIPFIENWKRKLEVVDPKLTEKEIPINQALALVLEKILLMKSFE